MYGALGVTPTQGTASEVLAMTQRVVSRNMAPQGNATRWVVTATHTSIVQDAAATHGLTLGTLNYSVTSLAGEIDAWRSNYASSGASSDIIRLLAATSRGAEEYVGASVDRSAASDGVIAGAPSQYLVPTETLAARNALRMLLAAAAGAIADAQDVSDPGVIVSYLRGRTPRQGAITARSIVGERAASLVRPGTNDPMAAAYDVVNRQGPAANTLVRVGTFTDRGYARFTGCQAGAEPDGDFACRACPVNSYKARAGSEACTSCPNAGKTRSRMITNGTTGADSSSKCLCPIGFYVRDTPLDETDAGTVCQPCTVAMLCGQVHLRLQDVRNAIGFWRGDPRSPVFVRCLSAGRCNASATTQPLIMTRSFEARIMNSTACTEGAEGPLCGVCRRGYGESPSDLCAPCPASSDVIMAVLFACFVAIVLVTLLAVVQVSVSPSYVAW